MTTANKFLFDTNFGEPSEEEVEKAKKETAEPEPPPPPTFSEEELAEARREGEAEGYKRGVGETQEGLDARMTVSLEQLAEHVKALFEEERNTVEEAMRDAVAVAAAIAVKMFPGLNRTHGIDEIIHLVADTLDRLREEPKVIIRIAEEKSDDLVDRIEELAEGIGFEGRLTVLTDETMTIGDCRIEWAEGGAERNSGEMWREIDEIVERYLSEAEAAAEEADEADEAETDGEMDEQEPADMALTESPKATADPAPEEAPAAPPADESPELQPTTDPAAPDLPPVDVNP
ncbi:FliH/SctL family protein [Magnetospira sp. QH-2]|uniref:FliH/SctL family protein n=1 Tax=Magnetospira sp. (strain QH-2) TaxID=1288970 RepID=UPI0003E81B89|nr:FliH/SctL family protein [Magnetospira sp. QH-2]CCQ73049.1 putative Flagellar assembly protein fliH [Magnetospira sp. QH-2]